MDKEIYKASIQYHIKQIISEVVSFTVVFAIIYYNMFNYKPGLFWIIESFVLILLLWLCGRDYKKRKAKMNEMLDNILEMREAWIKHTLEGKP